MQIYYIMETLVRVGKCIILEPINALESWGRLRDSIVFNRPKQLLVSESLFVFEFYLLSFFIVFLFLVEISSPLLMMLIPL